MNEETTVLYNGDSGEHHFGGPYPKIEIVKAIRCALGISLREAKSLVDRATTLTPVRLCCPDAETAKLLMNNITEWSGTARIVHAS